MENTKKLIQILTRIQIISSIVWAILLIICYQILGESYKEISLILICGFFIEFLLISSSKNNLKNRMHKRKEDKYFEEILERNKHKIYRICNIYAVPPLEAQDLFQEVVYQIWKSLDSFKSNSSIDTWVYKISINVCLRSKMKFEKIIARQIGLNLFILHQ